MPEPDKAFPFARLRRKLLASGVAPQHANRTIQELRDHLDDLKRECNLSNDELNTRLGNPHQIAEQIIARHELKDWMHRYPKIARVYLPCAYVLLLPAVPLFAGAANPNLLLRWGLSLLLGAGVTASMFRILQLSIAPT